MQRLESGTSTTLNCQSTPILESSRVTPLPDGFLQRMARAGALAPSGDNLQPWSFTTDGSTLLIKHDAQRDRSLFNVQHLASFIALGAVLENVVIAATKDNYHAKIAYFPDAQDDTLIARIDFAYGASTDALADYLDKRCTNRKPFKRRGLDDTAKKQLDVDRARFPGVEISWLDDKDALIGIGKVVAKADRLLFENPLIHGHLFSTIRWNQTEVEQTRDGLPIKTLELGMAGSYAFRVLKNWSVVQTLNRIGFSVMAAKQSALLMRRCSAAGLITAPDTSPLSFLRVGQVFQRVWLEATRTNLALQPMTAVIFLQLRSILGDHQGLTQEQVAVAQSLRSSLARTYSLARDRVPAMHFRIGYASAPSERTVRRREAD